MKWIFPAFILLAVIGSLPGIRPVLERYLPKGSTSRTRAERQAEAQIEEIEGLPGDVELDAHSYYFKPDVRPEVRAALLRTIGRRPRLREEMADLLAQPDVTKAWRTLHVLADLDPSVGRGLDPEVNRALRRLARAIAAAPHEKPRHFYDWEEVVTPVLAASRALTARGVDCRPGVREVLTAAERYPPSPFRDPFVREARAWLAEEEASRP